MTLYEIRESCRPSVPAGWTAFYTLDVADHAGMDGPCITYSICLVRGERCESVKASTPRSVDAQFCDMVRKINGTPHTEASIAAADAGEFAEVPA